jgi:hypothetical protein
MLPARVRTEQLYDTNNQQFPGQEALMRERLSCKRSLGCKLLDSVAVLKLSNYFDWQRLPQSLQSLMIRWRYHAAGPLLETSNPP